MTNRYLIERRKAGTGEYYMMRTVEASNFRAAADSVKGDFSPGESMRISLMSVEVTAVLTEERTWDVTASK